jgi:hypothetical protein
MLVFKIKKINLKKRERKVFHSMNPDPSLSHIVFFLCLSFFLPGEKISNAPHRLPQCKPGNVPFCRRLVLSIESERLERLADIVPLVILNHIPLNLLLEQHISHRNCRAQQFYQAAEIECDKVRSECDEIKLSSA